MIYGYVRVSTGEQNEDRQLIALTEAGVEKANLFIDKQSGKDFARKSYRKMLGNLKKGDLLIVKSIDRLGRNYREIMEQWRKITHEINADIKVIDMALLDTTRRKDLMGTFISDLVLQILSFIAENERENIRHRQQEGIEAARARGVRFGRPERKISPEIKEILMRYRHHEICLQEALDACKISKSTFYRWLKKTAADTTLRQ